MDTIKLSRIFQYPILFYGIIALSLNFLLHDETLN